MEEIEATLDELKKFFSALLVKTNHQNQLPLFQSTLTLLFYTASRLKECSSRLKECSSEEAISETIEDMWKVVKSVSNDWIKRFYSRYFGRYKKDPAKLPINSVKDEIKVFLVHCVHHFKN